MMSRAEKNVYDLVVKGLSNKNVAKKLNLSVKTIKFHLTAIFKKKGVKSRSELVSLHYSSGDVTIKEIDLFRSLFK